MRISTAFFANGIVLENDIKIILQYYVQLNGPSRTNLCGNLIKEVKRKPAAQ
jgi:hypothetical protein